MKLFSEYIRTQPANSGPIRILAKILQLHTMRILVWPFQISESEDWFIYIRLIFKYSFIVYDLFLNVTFISKRYIINKVMLPYRCIRDFNIYHYSDCTFVYVDCRFGTRELLIYDLASYIPRLITMGTAA